jgi:TPR repeat protein
MKQRIKTLFAGGVLALALIGVAAAGQFEDGEAAYRRGDYAEALRLLRPLAEQGDADAQRTLGAMYKQGQGVPQDHDRAVAWYQKAVDQMKAVEDGEAAYANGDYAEALRLLRPLADQGNDLAQTSLGLMYE